MKKPVLLQDTKRCWIYQYGTDGMITISKRIELGDEVDYLDLLESGEVQIKNSTDSKSTIDLCGHILDTDALTALDIILGELA